MDSQTLKSQDLKTISIVGNGPISEKDAPNIDKSDIVLRFNSAPACGAAGQRVDILLINRARVYMSKRVNPVALHRAAEVWVNDSKKNGQVDWLFERECKPIYLGPGPMKKARKHLENYDPFLKSNPTTGASIIAELIETRPELKIHLFGFTHQGKQQTHDWDAEKRWTNDLIAQGKIVAHRTPGNMAQRNLEEKVNFCFRVIEKQTKHYFYNRLLHSAKETKARIFGEHI